MHNIATLLEAKGKEIWTIEPRQTAFKALETMAQKNVGALLVVDRGKLVGIFSERDYARKVILKGKSSKETTVGELMTRDVFYADPEDTLQESMALMTAKHIRHMPVLKDNNLIGMVTLGDVVKGIISEQKFTINELEKYISGGYEI
ncbi:MAG: CBS domain-containing protein [Desulfobacterales bacterium]|jgi:CBS domain-containing protein